MLNKYQKLWWALYSIDPILFCKRGVVVNSAIGLHNLTHEGLGNIVPIPGYIQGSVWKAILTHITPRSLFQEIVSNCKGTRFNLVLNGEMIKKIPIAPRITRIGLTITP